MGREGRAKDEAERAAPDITEENSPTRGERPAQHPSAAGSDGAGGIDAQVSTVLSLSLSLSWDSITRSAKTVLLCVSVLSGDR